MVKERTGTFKGTGVWKFPTGVVDAVSRFLFSLAQLISKVQDHLLIMNKFFFLKGEDICTAAVREVQEETGVSVPLVPFMNKQKVQTKDETLLHDNGD